VSRRPHLRAYALIALGALVVHELRYAVTSGQVSGVSGHDGHAYLGVLAPAVGSIAAFGLAWLVARAAGAPARRVQRRRLAVVWPLASLAILGTFGAQELLEALVAPGHPTLGEGVFGAGAWTAIPLGVVAGAAVAWAMRLTAALEASAAPASGWIAELALAGAAPAARIVRDDAPLAMRSRAARAARGPPSPAA
jgi:hypothetical protein